MNVKEYIEKKIETSARYTVNQKDKELLKNSGVEEFIYHTVTNKKFRKWSVDKSSETAVKRAINLSVAKNKPILFTYPFGGYKLWRMPGAPEADWAEFFTISYCLGFVSPILKTYPPGVEFFFPSEDVISREIDNISAEETGRYFSSFEILLDVFRKHFPKNLRVSIVRTADLYKSPEELKNDIKEKTAEVKSQFSGLPAKTIQKELKMAKLNIKWEGAKDLRKLTSLEKKEFMEKTIIIKASYTRTEKRNKFVRGENKVVLFPSPSYNSISIGTTENSIVKFWTGFGVLEYEKEFSDRILSPKQYKAAKNLPHKVVKINIIPLINFREIWVYPKKFNFKQSNIPIV